MPWVVKKTPKGYGVWNKHKKTWKSYNTSLSNAQAQYRLLEYIGHIKI